MQIVGIARVDARAAVAALHQLAVIPTGPTVAAMTAEAYSKEHAWHVALTLGILDVKEWVAEAIDNEPNTYQQHNFMNIAAVLSVPSLPSRVVSLLSSKELMFTRAGHNKELFPFLGASRLAASSLTRDSLRLLLGAEGLMDGHPFVASVDHAAELATWLVKTGDTDLLNELEDAFRSRRPMTCDVAIRTVRILFAGGSSTCISDTILEMLEYNSLDDLYPAYVRADAISARAAAGNLSASFSAALADICKNENEELRVAAAYVLIRAGMLDRYREALHGCAFHSSGGQITVEPSERLTTSEAYLVGWLAATEPAVYARSAARIIEVAFTLAASETIRAIRTAKRTGVKPPDLVCAAIVRCIRDHESPGFANTHLFGELAELDAERLLNEPWERIWQEWMADSRRALADALPEAIRQSADGSSRERAIAIAKALLTDGVFAVRRSAARALGELDQGALRAVCEEYLSSGSIVLRERTAEAAGWLPIDDENTLDNAILRRLGGDSEDRVRDAAKRTREEARRRCWAAEHLRVVLGADSDPNLWVLRKYASGAALAKIGDDRDMLALATHARGSDVPPNVRHWYGRVLKDLDRQWRETTRKWPDPWRPWRGSIEKLGGSLVVKERTYPAQFSLWLVPPQHDLGLTSWGGAADLDKGDAWSLLREYSDSENSRGIVRIEGRAEARALMVRVSGSEVLLSGSGPYPAGVANL
jgi:HEAT repeat protein